jgi:hypothetical protein
MWGSVSVTLRMINVVSCTPSGFNIGKGIPLRVKTLHDPQS